MRANAWGFWSNFILKNTCYFQNLLDFWRDRKGEQNAGEQLSGRKHLPFKCEDFRILLSAIWISLILLQQLSCMGPQPFIRVSDIQHIDTYVTAQPLKPGTLPSSTTEKKKKSSSTETRSAITLSTPTQPTSTCANPRVTPVSTIVRDTGMNVIPNQNVGKL